MRKLSSLALVAIVMIAPVWVNAQVPNTMQFQGFLTDTNQVPYDGYYTFVFAFHSGETASAPILWSDEMTVHLDLGYVDVVLGTNGTPLDYGVFAPETTIFLRVTIDGEALEPAFEVTSVPYAMWAGNALTEEDIRVLLASDLLC